jgi:putative transcriptional regulator
MSKKLTGRALAQFEAKRDVWQEVLDGVREIKAGRGKRSQLKPLASRTLSRTKTPS